MDVRRSGLETQPNWKSYTRSEPLDSVKALYCCTPRSLSHHLPPPCKVRLIQDASAKVVPPSSTRMPTHVLQQHLQVFSVSGHCSRRRSKGLNIRATWCRSTSLPRQGITYFCFDFFSSLSLKQLAFWQVGQALCKNDHLPCLVHLKTGARRVRNSAAAALETNGSSWIGSRCRAVNERDGSLFCWAEVTNPRIHEGFFFPFFFLWQAAYFTLFMAS